jgi:uncharacterized protein YdhG (YjbR/CyaY superfamily)
MRRSREVDEYISQFPKETKQRLSALREIIHRALPRADETISYNMPTFSLNGDKLVSFAAFKSHIGLYPGARTIEHFHSELSAFKSAKGSVQFSMSLPLPAYLVTRMLRFRYKLTR